MSEAFKIEDIFAENVFTVAKMKERLPLKSICKSRRTLWTTVDSIAIEDADVIAKSNEGLGTGKRSHTLHTLVPAIALPALQQRNVIHLK